MPHDGFLHDICACPADDTPRLVYADWLEENGEPDLAEFIRVQIELASLGEVGPRVAALKMREQDLLVAHATEWLKPLRLAESRVLFRRGFVAEVQMSPARFMNLARRLFRRAPITTLRVDSKDALIGMDELPHSEYLRLLTTLRLETLLGDEDDLIALLRPLFNSPHLGGLTNLFLGSNVFSGSIVTAVLRAKHLGGVRYLDLGFNELNDGAAARLARSSFLGQLSALNLSGNDIGNTGVAALAKSENLSNLRALGLAYTDMSVRGLRDILAAPLPPLRKLTLGCNEIGDEGARLVARSAKLAELRELDLGDCRLTVEAARVLASSSRMAGLTMLQLGNEINGGNAIADEGVAVIAHSKHLSNVLELDVGDNEVTADGVRALVESPMLGHLYGLNLSDNPIGTAGVRFLANSPHAANLHVLGLQECDLDNEAALALAQSPLLGHFTYLGISETSLRPDGLAALRQRFGSGLQTGLSYEKARENRNWC